MPREVFSIICDDMRIEAGNKTSLMGVYSDGIIVPAIPFPMMRLCLYQELDDVENIRNLRVDLRGPKLSLKALLTLSKQPTKKFAYGPFSGLYNLKKRAIIVAKPILKVPTKRPRQKRSS
jgi:hypothetical protein